MNEDSLSRLRRRRMWFPAEIGPTRPARRRWAALFGLVLTAAMGNPAAAQTTCLDCHSDRSLARPSGKPGELFVDEAIFHKSSHASIGCAECHKDAVLVNDEHKPKLALVDCGSCHAEQQALYARSLHGQALARGDALAPHCWSCHGNHDVQPPSYRESRTYKMNVPAMCGQCHSEDRGLSRTHAIDQHNVVENYSMSGHAEGLFKRGLLVSAACVDCHGSHLVLRHEDAESLINHDNVAKTCTKCHAAIEQVHRKVIEQRLWQEKPETIPACIDCHQPHKVRRVRYSQQAYADEDCLSCHRQANLTAQRNGKPVSMFVDTAELSGSAHARNTCVKCHSNVSTGGQRPCEHVGRVDCASCHSAQVEQHRASIHGQLAAQGNAKAPTCTTCHGDHHILKRADPAAPTNVRNEPTLCARCHSTDLIKSRRTPSEIGPNPVASYQNSIHGKGLVSSGLVVTAVCSNCHTSHAILPAADPRSSVSTQNLAKTCAACHTGIYEQLEQSVHGPSHAKPGQPVPDCDDCHSSHHIDRVDTGNFRTREIARCGRCHGELTASYFDTYHGKVSLLGEAKTAKCADCHTAHQIQPVTDPRSSLSRDRIVATCGKCHEGSHRRFAGYLTHATHKDPQKYPVIYYTFWFMTLLLFGTLGFFTLHTLLWLPRSIKVALTRRRRHRNQSETKYVQRFVPYHRLTHLLVIVSFFSLVVTGMMLKFSYADWARALSSLLGGFEVAGAIHRIAAIVTFIYFCMHLFYLVRQKRRSGRSWLKFIFHPESAMLNWRDAKEFWQTMKWFFGRGPRPDYGRFTYWEKFDYFAVFWGVAVIGLSGLMLWFPEQATYILPGWAINVATIIHSDEALLAAAFIFTVHFFNTHFRPERFPMDPVIFTGRMTLAEFQEERPREYRLAKQAGTLDSMIVSAPAPRLLLAARIFGLVALLVGLTLVGLIVYSMFFVYR